MKMKLKGVAIATVLAISSFTPAKAAVFEDLGLSYIGQYTFKSTVSEASGFWSIMEELALTQTYNEIAGFFASKLGINESIEGTSDIGKFGGRVTTPWFGQITFENQTISFSSASFNDQVTTFSDAVVPVPGPEAGAGLGALAMAGMAYVAMRRRKQNLAA